MKYIIKYDYGYGMEYEEVEAENRDAALEIAYEAWKEGAESNADYNVIEYNEENAERYL